MGLCMSWYCKIEKSRGPVNVTFPGEGISDTEAKTDDRRGSVGPKSMRKAITAIVLSVAKSMP